jgi:hypothetical protein
MDPAKLKRDGWPMKEEDSLTGGVPMDDYAACNITRKQDGVDLYAKAPFPDGAASLSGASAG